MEIEYTPLLAKRTTLGLGGEALALLKLHDRQDCLAMKELASSLGGELRILGGGSNILASDRKLALVLAEPLFGQSEIMDYEEIGEQEAAALENRIPPLAAAFLKDRREDFRAARIRVGAGLRMPTLLKFCSEYGLSGLEGLAGIPGRLGGAVAMNAGAYGCDMNGVLESVTIYTENQEFHTLHRGEFEAGYRYFSASGINHMDNHTFHDGYGVSKQKDTLSFMIIEASLILPHTSRQNVKDTIQQNLESKKKSQPVNARTAGCVFQNPPEKSAGKLLDEAGFKGKTLGGMRFSPQHANFLENTGAGTATQALELLNMAEQDIFRKFGLKLKREVRIWT